MGIVQMNSLRDYWSTKWMFKNDVARNIMSRNRFELLLKMLHFSDKRTVSRRRSLMNIFVR
nr:unnamed protein product [Callosobruchus chinensis]